MVGSTPRTVELSSEKLALYGSDGARRCVCTRGDTCDDVALAAMPDEDVEGSSSISGGINVAGRACKPTNEYGYPCGFVAGSV